MFESLTEDKDAISVLKEDHNKVKNLFNRFEKAESRDEREQIASTVIEELKIHTTIEEEIFYPAVRGTVDAAVMNEADEEHHVAKILIAELENLDSADDHFSAKFIVLAESVRHHIEEEEGKMFPQAREGDLNLEAMGQELLERKQELEEEGFPVSPEEKMVAHKRAAASPAISPSRRMPKGKAHMRSPSKNGHDAGRRTRT